MAGGLLGFLGFGKKSKPNLVPDILPPSASDAPLYGQLKDFASKRIAGQDTGFGDNFVSKMSNPAIAQIDANFQNRTLPTLNSQASAKGIGRSTLALDQIGQADLSRNRDISSMMADFYKLNEAQKKSDQQFGVQTGENLDNQFLNQGNQQATSSADIRDKTLGVANNNNTADRLRQNQTIGSLMNMVVPGSGMAFSPATTPSNQPNNQPTNSTQGSATANVLKTGVDDSTLTKIEAYLKSKGLI